MSSVSGRHTVTFFRSVSAMVDAGIPLFAIFEFLARTGEHKALSEACGRIAQRLVGGASVHFAVSQEPQFFSPKAVRMMEAGFTSGAFPTVLKRLALDEERAWLLKEKVKSQLVYPMWIAFFGLIAILVLPPLVLVDILETVVQMTGEPPALSRFLLNFSSFLASPYTWLCLACLSLGAWFLWKRPESQTFLDEREHLLWEVPGIGPLWKDLVSSRFLRVFAMSYESGLPATLCLQLAASSSGSSHASRRGRLMKQHLMAGASLTESIDNGDILAPMAIESIKAGEQVGEIPAMLNSAADMIEAELENRIEAVSKLVEPFVLTTLGVFVGVFALGCLLPIISLVEQL